MAEIGQPNGAWQLRAGQPLEGAKAQAGSTFVGWVLVQVWEATTKSDGVVIQSSGDQKVLLPRVAHALTGVASQLNTPPVGQGRLTSSP